MTTTKTTADILAADELKATIERLEKLDAERTQGDWMVISPNTAPAIRNKGGIICSFRVPCKYTGQDDRYASECKELSSTLEFIAFAPEMAALIRTQSAEIERLRKERDMAVEGLRGIRDDDASEWPDCSSRKKAKQTLAQIEGERD